MADMKCNKMSSGLSCAVNTDRTDLSLNSMDFPLSMRSFNSFPMTKHIALSSLLLIALAIFGGCRTLPYDGSGQNFAVFQFGEFKMLVNTTAPIATEAVEKAVQQLDLFKTYEVKNKYETQILARARNDQRITINIEETNSRQTTIRIRWGEGGDLAKSRKLFDAADANLK